MIKDAVLGGKKYTYYKRNKTENRESVSEQQGDYLVRRNKK